MRFMQKWRWRLRALFGRRRVEAELSDEMRFHLEKEIETRIRSGMSPKEAKRSAYVDFGGEDRFRGQVTEALWGNRLLDAIRGLRFAHRRMAKGRGFTLVILLTIGLAVGATTAIFTIVDAALLQPLPYPESDRLALVTNHWNDAERGDLSQAEYVDYLEAIESMEAFGTYTFGSLNRTDEAVAEQIRTGFPSAGALAALRPSPILGRLYSRQEEEDGLNVGLILEGAAISRYGSVEAALGSSMVLNGTSVELIGVLDDDFRLPEDLRSGQRAELMLPLGITRQNAVPDRGGHYLKGIGRLVDGVSLTLASQEVSRIAAEFVARFPEEYPAGMQFGGSAVSLREEIAGPARPIVGLLFGSVSVLLILACANVASMLIAQAEWRRQEFDLRRTLGAAKRRLLGQVVTEGLVYGAWGGGLGLALSVAFMALIRGLDPGGIPRFEFITIDRSVIGFLVATSAGFGLLIGLLPASRFVSKDQAELAGSSRGSTGRTLSTRMRRVLVGGEIALALVLLSGAGLFGKSFYNLISRDPGYDVENILTARVSLPGAEYNTDESRRIFFRQVADGLHAVPGVQSAGAVTNLPLATGLGDLNFRVEGREYPEGVSTPRADWQVITPGYFDAIGIQVLRGRGILPTDRAESTGVAVISEGVAEQYWPNEDPIGARFELGGGAGPGMVTVVGIVADVFHESLADTPNPQMYLAHEQFRFWNGGPAVRSMTLVARADSPSESLPSAIRAVVGSVDGSLPLFEVRWMETVRSDAVSQPRAVVAILLLFSVVSVLLAGVGVYGVTAYSVGQRSREFGVRIALGARPGEIQGLVLREGLWVSGTGLAVGLLAVVILGRPLGELLFNVRPTDFTTLLFGSLMMAVTVLTASLLPARRASSVSPMTPLRDS